MSTNKSSTVELSQHAEDELVKVEGVSKKFCKSLKRSLWYGVQDIGQELKGRKHNISDSLRKDEFWAVRDISFELKRGECIGIVGHNGAGKSTLLKILNGLIKPDQGRVTMRGRVGALIELGAGFNPILSGRENIYANGQVLGFTKMEIDEKFDQIVEFAEIGDFINMPVQNYSSGMRVRLGFAVAAQMEPDILILDEVLAVGDLGFQIKCLNRIQEITSKSAVIFVSHSMTSVARICSHAILMKQGKRVSSSSVVSEIIDAYHMEFDAGEKRVFGSDDVEIKKVLINGSPSQTGTTVPFGGDIQIDLEVKVHATLHNELIIRIQVWNQDQYPVCEITDENFEYIPLDGDIETVSVKIGVPRLRLLRGKYFVTVSVCDRYSLRVIHMLDKAAYFVMASHHPSSCAYYHPAQWTRLDRNSLA